MIFMRLTRAQILKGAYYFEYEELAYSKLTTYKKNKLRILFWFN